jgi:hypothetical protein
VEDYFMDKKLVIGLIIVIGVVIGAVAVIGDYLHKESLKNEMKDIEDKYRGTIGFRSMEDAQRYEEIREEIGNAEFDRLLEEIKNEYYGI